MLPQIKIAKCQDYQRLVNQLSTIFNDVIADDSYLVTNPEDHNAIWVGYDVPTEFVIHAINITKKQWRWLSCIDIINFPPNRIYIGGIAHKRLNLNKWSDSDFRELEIDWSVEKLHEFIRKVNHPMDLSVDES